MKFYAEGVCERGAEASWKLLSCGHLEEGRARAITSYLKQHLLLDYLIKARPLAFFRIAEFLWEKIDEAEEKKKTRISRESYIIKS